MHEPKPLQDRKLYWVAKNLARPDFVRKIGDWVVPLGSVLASENADLQAISELISGRIDEEFYDHCWVGSFRVDCLVIHVDEPALVAPLQRRYAESILKAVSAEKKYRCVNRVVFQLGRGGSNLRRTSASDRPITL